MPPIGTEQENNSTPTVRAQLRDANGNPEFTSVTVTRPDKNGELVTNTVLAPVMPAAEDSPRGIYTVNAVKSDQPSFEEVTANVDAFLSGIPAKPPVNVEAWKQSVDAMRAQLNRLNGTLSEGDVLAMSGSKPRTNGAVLG